MIDEKKFVTYNVYKLLRYIIDAKNNVANIYFIVSSDKKEMVEVNIEVPSDVSGITYRKVTFTPLNGISENDLEYQKLLSTFTSEQLEKMLSIAYSMTSSSTAHDVVKNFL